MPAVTALKGAKQRPSLKLGSENWKSCTRNEKDDAGSTIAKFLQKRSGLHHVCVLVEDIDAALAELRARGVSLIDEKPRPGAGGSRVAFVHPRAGAGVLLELKEKSRRR